MSPGNGVSCDNVCASLGSVCLVEGFRTLVDDEAFASVVASTYDTSQSPNASSIAEVVQGAPFVPSCDGNYRRTKDPPVTALVQEDGYCYYLFSRNSDCSTSLHWASNVCPCQSTICPIGEYFSLSLVKCMSCPEGKHTPIQILIPTAAPTHIAHPHTLNIIVGIHIVMIVTGSNYLAGATQCSCPAGSYFILGSSTANASCVWCRAGTRMIVFLFVIL